MVGEERRFRGCRRIAYPLIHQVWLCILGGAEPDSLPKSFGRTPTPAVVDHAK
jgi:hypothetical protein